MEALRQQLAESQQTAEALRGSGVEARAQALEYGERARRAETLNQEHSADLASLRYLATSLTTLVLNLSFVQKLRPSAIPCKSHN